MRIFFIVINLLMAATVYSKQICECEKELKPIARQDITEGQYLLAVCYIEGYRLSLSCPQRAQAGKEILENILKREKWSDPYTLEAGYLLSRLYLFGIGAKKSMNKYHNLVSNMAKKGHVPSITAYGESLVLGLTKEKNRSKGLKYLKDASQKGHKRAKLLLAEYSF